jgi:hypothetical protein
MWEIASRIGAPAALLIAAMVTGISWLLGATDTESSMWPWRIAFVLAAGVLLLAAFMLWRLPEPVRPATARSFSPWRVIAMGVLAFAGTSALSRLHSAAIDSHFTLDKLPNGLPDTSYYVISGVGGAILGIAGMLLGGRLTDRRGARFTVVGGMLAGIALTGITAIVVHVNTNMITALLSALWTGAFAFAFAGLVVAVARQLPARVRATGLGIISCVPGALIGLLVTRGRFDPLTHVDLVMFAIQGAIVVAGLIAMWVLTSRPKEVQPA